MKNRIADLLPTAWRQRTEPGQSRQGPALPQWRQVVEPVENVVTKYPAAALAAAFAAGVMLAWWIKRR
jgi:hypothetical protein